MVLAIDGLVPTETRAGSPSAAGAIRARQAAAEQRMRRADHQIARLLRLRDHRHRGFRQAAHQLKRAVRQRDTARLRMERRQDALATARLDRDRTLHVHPAPSGHQVVDRAALRRRVVELRRTVHRLERKIDGLDRRVQRARRAKHVRVHGVSRGRVAARVAERERAEDTLSGQVTLMLALSKARAASRFSVSSGRGFAKPARGHTSQGYGCQSARGHGARRHCARFHDGIDIAAPVGTPIRASADGYVAYVGWNPWDDGRRSFVVIIGHAHGLETIYAHLRPGSPVKAGQFVRRGQRIGSIGLTGRTSGPHVHWEVSRDFHTLDPRRAGR